MIIVAGGDSFVYGSELADCNGIHSTQTFPALLAGQHEYDCVAWPGYGNDSIARTVITRCEELLAESKQLFVIVSWTFPGRYEFRFDYNTGQRNSPWYTINPWTIEKNLSAIEEEFHTKSDSVLYDQMKTIYRARTSGVAEFAKTFYTHVGGNEYWEVYSSIKEVLYLQNYLKVKNINYLFTCADNSILYNYTVNNKDSIISGIYNQIDMTQWFWFPEGACSHETCDPRGFYQWAVENKYPVGTTHPLEQAHQVAADLIKDRFNEMVKKSVQ